MCKLTKKARFSETGLISIRLRPGGMPKCLRKPGLGGKIYEPSYVQYNGTLRLIACIFATVLQDPAPGS
jgi:hypothetical protein